MVYTAIRWVWQGLRQPLKKSKKSPQLPKFQNHHFGNQFFPEKNSGEKTAFMHLSTQPVDLLPKKDMTTGLATFGEDLTRLTGTVGSCTQTLCHLSQENVDIIKKYTTWVSNGMLKIPRYWGLLFCTQVHLLEFYVLLICIIYFQPGDFTMGRLGTSWSIHPKPFPNSLRRQTPLCQSCTCLRTIDWLQLKMELNLPDVEFFRHVQKPLTTNIRPADSNFTPGRVSVLILYNFDFCLLARSVV